MVCTSKTIGGTGIKVETAAEIFSKHGDFIRGIIRYQVKNDAYADDLCQDFFLTLVSNPPPKGIQNIRSYLYRAITNDIIDSFRRMELYRTRIQEYATGVNYFRVSDIPDRYLMEKEQTRKVFGFLEKRLPRTKAEAIALKYRDDYDIDKVAKEMDIDKRTVSRYISVGFRRIRKLLVAKQGN